MCSIPCVTTPSHPQKSNGYAVLLGELKKRIRSARLRAALAVNQELTLLYWSIGRDILARQVDEGWGARVIDRLSADLRRDFPEMTGLSSRNLKCMRAFAEAHPDQEVVQQVVARLSWAITSASSRRLRIRPNACGMRVKPSRSAGAEISLPIRLRAGCSTVKVRQSRTSTAPCPPQSELAQQLVKDPYSFDFLALGPEVSERQLERGLLEHIRALILELGKGFAFVGS